LITPGLVDLGVFAIDKPALHFGGITRAALMPDQNPPDRPSTVRYAAQSSNRACGFTRWPPPRRAGWIQDMAEIAMMRDAGAKPLQPDVIGSLTRARCCVCCAIARCWA
jgi:dihydroorotase